MTEDSNRQLAKLVPHDQKTQSAFRHVVGGAWEVLIGRGMSKPSEIEFEQVDDTVRHEQFLQKKGLLRYKPAHEEVPIMVLQPRGETRRTALWIDPAGKSALFDCEGSPKPAVLKLLEHGIQVVGMDLFGQGEFLPDGDSLSKTRKVQADKRASAAYTFGYNRAVFAQRVHDVLTAASYYRGDEQPLGVVDIVGLNGAGHWAAAAKAIAGKAIDRTVIDTASFRFVNLKSTEEPDFLPGAVKYEDVPGLLALCAPSEIWVADAASSQHKPEIVEAVYQAAGAGGHHLVHWSGRRTGKHGGRVADEKVESKFATKVAVRAYSFQAWPLVCRLFCGNTRRTVDAAGAATRIHFSTMVSNWPSIHWSNCKKA